MAYNNRMNIPIVVQLSSDIGVNNDLTAVVRSVTDEFEIMCPGVPPAGLRPINVRLGASRDPLTDSTSDIKAYNILLTVNGRYYNQIAYQLAHELCHIYSDPRRSNWLTECFCELASLMLLDRMALAWNQAPPFPNWREFAPTFSIYAQEYITSKIREIFNCEELPNKDELKKWLGTVAATLKNNACDRSRNTIIALMLRPVFEESSNYWKATRYMGQASVNPPVLLTEFNENTDFEFIKWENAVPDELKSAVRRVYLIFIDIGLI